MTAPQQQLANTIAGLEAQRALLGDAAVDAVLVPLRAQLAALQAGADPAAPAPAQTLRQVTVLFLDVVGSTTLSQHLDPEDIHALMDGALARSTSIVEAHQGKVLQYAGDSLLAVFGADEAHEDDAERAVHAGLALLDEGKRQGQAVAQRHGHEGFNLRVGIHTGGVLLGGGVDADSSIRGMTVNVAARMEQTAPPGGLRISQDTQRQVRGLFDLEPQAALLVKGRDEPILTYLVRHARPRTFRVATRGIEGLATRMVGRVAEMAQLQRAFEGLFGDGRLAILSVVADAGIGKSRLLFEFEAWTMARTEVFTVLRGRANPQTQTQPYGLLRDILARWLQIGDGDAEDAARRKVEDGIAPLFAADDGAVMALANAHVLGHLIGLDFSDSPHLAGILADGRLLRSRGLQVAAQIFSRVHASSGAPILLLLDDLHWADDASLEFLGHLAQASNDLPMLVLGLSRPALFERRTDLFCGIDRRIVLEPLGEQSSRELAGELLRKLVDVPVALHELVNARAEGNPFYMEELVLMLIDGGVIDTSAEPWKVVAGKLEPNRIPHTLTGVLQARLDKLNATEKLALQQASVIGFVFWDIALAAIDSRATEALPAVERREFVVASGQGPIDGAREYAFRHHILHQVTYETVLKRVRRDCHARAAAWFSSVTGARANDFLGVTAEHFEKAGDSGNACEYYARAAEHAATRFAHDALFVHVRRAMALADQGEDRGTLLMRWRLLAMRERALDLRGHREEQAADIDQLKRLADALDDDRLRADAAWRRCDIALRKGDYRATEVAARQAMALADQVGAVELKLRCQQRLAIACTCLGDHASARSIALQGLEAARALRLSEVEMRFNNALALVASNQSDLLAMLQFAEQALLISREIGDLRAQSIELCNVGASLLSFGAHTQAASLIGEGLRLSRSCGIRNNEGTALSNLAELALRRGDPALALAHAQASLDLAKAVQDPSDEAYAALALGDAALALGRHADAADAFARSREAACAVGHPLEFHAIAGLARVALACSETASALCAVEELLPHLKGDADGDATQNMLVRLTCFRVLERAGDARAIDVLAAAHTALQARAASFGDAELRKSFLANVPEHNALVAAWTAYQAANQV